MIKKHGDLDEVLAKALNTVEFNPRRSSLFWYLYRIHDDLLRRAKGGRITWSHVCTDLEPLGLLDGEGKSPTPQRASRTFASVRALKAQEQAARDKRRRTRSREAERGANADRPPLVVTTPTPRPPVPCYPPPSSSIPPVQGTLPAQTHEALSKEERLAEAKAEVLRLRRVFAVRSGHDPDKIK